MFIKVLPVLHVVKSPHLKPTGGKKEMSRTMSGAGLPTVKCATEPIVQRE